LHSGSIDLEGPSTGFSAAAPVCILQIEHPVTGQLTRFWLENAVVGRPTKEDAAAATMDQRLFPSECRESVSNAAALHGKGRSL